MKINNLSLSESKLLIDTSISGKELVYLTISELIGLQAIALEKEETLLIAKAERFNLFNQGNYAIFHQLVDEYYERLEDPDKLREPLLTPHRLVEKVYNKSDKNFENYKKLLWQGLRSKKLMKPVRWLWKRYELTRQGQSVKHRITEQINLFEITFQKWKDSRQQSQADELKEIIRDLGSLIMLSDQVNKDSLQELKAAIDQSTPITVDYQTEVIVDAMWYMDADWLGIDFDIFDIFD